MNYELPNDPVMLLSLINMKLRDFYPSLDALCDDMHVDKAAIVYRLEAIDYHYDDKLNKFV